MLESLHVRNYVLIDSLDLDFDSGFSCITGETGSGKSIILGALSLLLGGKADKSAIRAGAEYTQVSGVFSALSEDARSWCEDQGIMSEDASIAVNRTIKANGRSVYTVNGTPVTRQEGAELGSMLIDIASQHASQALLKSDVLLSMLDEASGSESVLRSYKEAYSEYKAKKDELAELKESIAKASEEQDYLRYCLNELDKCSLREGEEEELKERASVIGAAELIAESVYKANEELSSASASLSSAASHLQKAQKKDQSLSSFYERLDSDTIELDDLLLSLKEYLDSVSFSESELDEINSRLAEIQRITRRFGGSEKRALEIRDEYRKRIDAFDRKDELISSCSELVMTLEKRAEELASELSDKRKKGASLLSGRIEDNLHSLGMSASGFRIRVESEELLGPSGMDSVSFMIRANKGEKESEIQNSASGGELSRILLAVKASLETEDNVSMLFDEIDSGLGGVTANSVAEKLSMLSERHQVIAITHLPQIAARASVHYMVYKEENDGRTVSAIRKIEGAQRVREIARLLSGDESRISIDHAKAMLDERGRS